MRHSIVPDVALVLLLFTLCSEKLDRLRKEGRERKYYAIRRWLPALEDRGELILCNSMRMSHLTTKQMTGVASLDVHYRSPSIVMKLIIRTGPSFYRKSDCDQAMNDLEAFLKGGKTLEEYVAVSALISYILSVPLNVVDDE